MVAIMYNRVQQPQFLGALVQFFSRKAYLKKMNATNFESMNDTESYVSTSVVATNRMNVNAVFSLQFGQDTCAVATNAIWYDDQLPE